jgi:uncharacterized Zn finger protein
MAFTETVKIDGELYDFDPEAETAQIPCENCGHINEVELTREGDEWVWYSFSCENCGHFNQR